MWFLRWRAQHRPLTEAMQSAWTAARRRNNPTAVEAGTTARGSTLDKMPQDVEPRLANPHSAMRQQQSKSRPALCLLPMSPPPPAGEGQGRGKPEPIHLH